MARVVLDERGLPEGYPFQADWERTPREVRAMLEAEEPGESGVVLLDVRLDREVAAARIDAAMHIPMQVLADRLDEIEAHVDARLVVF